MTPNYKKKNKNKCFLYKSFSNAVVYDKKSDTLKLEKLPVVKVKQKRLLNREKLFNKIIKGKDLIGTTLNINIEILDKNLVVKSKIYKIITN